MGVGKYSPTVSGWYQKNKNWFKEVAPEQNNGLVGYDKDGYDHYGYNKDDVDRAGVKEFEYLQGEEIGDEYVYVLYNRVYEEWCSKPLPY